MEIKKNITSIFMVPTLNFPKDILKQNGFINGYIKDDRNEVQYEDSVYILFKPTDIDKFRKFLDDEYERNMRIRLKVYLQGQDEELMPVYWYEG